MLINPIYALVFVVFMSFFYYIVESKWAKKSFVMIIASAVLLTLIDSFFLVIQGVS